jgi:hypothetical protein
MSLIGVPDLNRKLNSFSNGHAPVGTQSRVFDPTSALLATTSFIATSAHRTAGTAGSIELTAHGASERRGTVAKTEPRGGLRDDF